MKSDQPFWKTIPKLSVLLVCLPVAIVMHVMGVDGMPLFVISAVGILGTVTLIGKATEEIACYAGPLWGGLMNATFGNVTELIIAMLALYKGLHDVVRHSIIGSILGNLLLVLGAAMLYGGTKYPVQRFSRTGAHINVGMLWIAVFALVVPSLVHFALQMEEHTKVVNTAQAAEESATDAHGEEASATGIDGEMSLIEKISMAGALILITLYALSLVFSLRTHRYLLMPGDDETHTAEWSKGFSIALLLGSTAVVAYLSEVFVGSIETMMHSGKFAMSELFIGVIVVAVVGNAAEGMVAVWVARDDKMELSFQVAMGSCLQVALLVAPILVIASYFMGGDLLTLQFNPFGLMALGAAVLISSAALNDGESNWLEGVMFLAVYLFFALVFWFHP